MPTHAVLAAQFCRLVQHHGLSREEARAKLHISDYRARAICKRYKIRSRWQSGGPMLPGRNAAVLRTHATGRQTWGYRALHQRTTMAPTPNIPHWQVRRYTTHVAPEMTLQRQRARVVRMAYHVPHPCAVWALDVCEKLQEGRVWIYGCVDAFSLRPMWLIASGRKCEMHHLSGYRLAQQFMGCIPDKLTADDGFENKWALQAHVGNGGRTKVTQSLRNIKIERFWGIMNIHLTHPLRAQLRALQNADLFDPDDHIDAVCMQRCLVYMFNDQLPEWLHMLCSLPVQRRGGAAHLNGKSRYECWQTPQNHLAHWSELVTTLQADVEFDQSPLHQSVLSAMDTVARTPGTRLRERFINARAVVRASM
eukprot:TRINITY_DN50358_c0_g1_i1.p2 TRINITY_DN50358_c0_g1~~TRINITY_DN50358_c0_g1_i1.p2  ORF type:complete len:386 (+),score=66.70 TRINITY_DN50358_c0_g1_i1:65-1159(+)